MAKYETEPLKCWSKAKKLRLDYYENYRTAHEKGGIRWAGGAWTFDAIPAGLGKDVYGLASEPYGASIAFERDLSMLCLETIEAKGYARDLCSYMRNYWGSVLLGKWPKQFGGGPFPIPDFIWQDHICCSHAKWYQTVSELEGGIPQFTIDVAAGAYTDIIAGPWNELPSHRLDYLVGQMHDGINWLEETTGRKYRDDLLIEAVKNDIMSTSLWAEICTLNKSIPAPLEEKSMYSLYVLAVMMKANSEVVDFYKELLEEVKQRVDNNIAAVENERFRIITDTQPPWGFLDIYRHMANYGAVSVGSLYTFALVGAWEIKDDGTWGARTPPWENGFEIEDRDSALRALAEWTLARPEWAHFYSPHLKTEMMKKIVKEWHCDGVVLHYNRGCEGLTIGIAENRLGLIESGIPVLGYEGNMGDEREFDKDRTLTRFDTWMDSQGLKIIEEEKG
ncbi:MAG: benzoyl-CoA reductase, bzd-type, subunit O [Candidatus Kariarchaeaceae archaeon]|jgi:benzoyl-CoA reductase subunit B